MIATLHIPEGAVDIQEMILCHKGCTHNGLVNMLRGYALDPG